ncbi:acetyl-CoA carboxylase, carboxyltransferase subunit beta [Terasakiella sp. A23]|uniref:acetyl-CoA carboxylase, carboxyltransferase subunit beta n=1 Tax=Terasakiella sp. FCG-A23 TaxID=3080561 RepID=UPI002953D2B9|nr:acetyl-CoA carboxylase, carboxyltransferase subunit beta [Terasakiella sp. A23]MDV7339949.1 acetyl-CoA carboxylase, carboxyltransferase subunit beta [Terasakiella sp. A23]
MNWLTNYVKPKLRDLVRPKEIPDNLWHKCTKCGQMIFHRDLDKNHHVCQHCGHHMRLSVTARLEMMFDNGEYTRAELPAVPSDPLKFSDRRKYKDRIKESNAKTKETDALVVGHGKMGGQNVVIAAFNFAYMGGSMGTAVGEGLVAASKLAIVQDAALIVVPASGGARMQEGILSLMQMARTTIGVERVKEAGLPYIVVLTDPTTGGVSASFAMLGDVAIAESGAVIGFAGRRVIEQTIREQLPDDFQTAEYLYEHGMVDMVVRRNELRPTLIRVLSLLRNTKPAGDLLELPQDDPIETEEVDNINDIPPPPDIRRPDGVPVEENEEVSSSSSKDEEKPAE